MFWVLFQYDWIALCYVKLSFVRIIHNSPSSSSSSSSIYAAAHTLSQNCSKTISHVPLIVYIICTSTVSRCMRFVSFRFVLICLFVCSVFCCCCCEKASYDGMYQSPLNSFTQTVYTLYSQIRYY
jgi:hypothetical protein